MSKKRLIVGLGNPGSKYRYTRHNLGFLVVEKLSENLKFKLALSSFTNGITAEGKFHEEDLILLLPLTYMNNSGAAVAQVLQSNEVAIEDVLVICDDFNLPFGQIRLRAKGSDGGHNGLSSVIEKLASDQFRRLRLGIGQPKGKETIDYVLEEFKRNEQKELESYVDCAVDCCHVWIEEGIEKAMEKFNKKI